ncbi:hypothetical protein KQI65_05625 [bacterium]|nr:hypothetical protein [bacterium]
MSMTRSKAQELLGLAVQAKDADECFAVLRSAEGMSQPLADNTLRPAQYSSDASMQISVRVGKRYMTVQCNELSAEGIRSAISRAVALAASMPESPEIYPFPSAAESSAAPLVVDGFRIEDGIDSAVTRQLLDDVRAKDMRFSGSLSSTRSSLALASSAGLFLHQESTLHHSSLRVYAKDGWSTGFAETYRGALDREAVRSALGVAMQKCAAWKEPVQIEGGRLSTVFEPRALADMLQPMLSQFSERAIEQDQSFLRRLDGSSFVGTKMFDERITLQSDPMYAELPSMPFTAEGLPVHPRTWVKNGVIDSITRERFSKKGDPVASPTNLIMQGGETPAEQLIAGIEKGLLVSGFAQLSMIDPRNCLLTGSTRDGLFMIEDGKITRGVRNVLIRETPVYLFKEIQDLGPVSRCSTTDGYFPMLLPHIRVKDVLYAGSSGVI